MKSHVRAALLLLAAACTQREAPSDATTGDAAAYEAPGVVALPLEAIAASLAAGDTTSAELTRAYLDRIEAIDRAGPALQSVLTLNPDAMKQAEASDARRAGRGLLGPLDGVPILIKDNVETADPMPTTAGSLALKDNLTGRDSPLVAALRARGAVILGKTNLSEWANYRSSESMSGWSALGGQTKNPHILDRNPCGSSSGSAVAVAASLAAGAVGTETNGSISCPSSVNGIVGFKPTVGLIPQLHIAPISASQDTAGPMTTTVEGAAMLLAAMTGGETDYPEFLDARALQGVRIGVARFAQGANPEILALFEAALKDLEATGAVLVEIEAFEPDAALSDNEETLLKYEFKAGLNAYLAEAAKAVETRSLDALIAFNKTHAAEELALFGQDIFEAAAKVGDLDSPEYVAARDALRKSAGEGGIDKLLGDYDVQALVAPSAPLASRIDSVNGDVWPQWLGIGYLAAIAGYPHLTAPMGAVREAPVGLSFIGARGADAAILSYGYAYEQRSRRRPPPRYLSSAEESPRAVEAMRRDAAQ